MTKNSKTPFERFVIDKVREKRRELGLSQDDVAEILDVTRGFIGQVESPFSPEKYNLNHLNQLALAFQCSPKEFLPEVGINKEDPRHKSKNRTRNS